MYENQTVARRSEESVLSTNKVLRNTYALLSMTLLFSAVTAGISMAMGWGFMSPLLVLGGYFGLLFLTTKFRNSSLGLVFVFALTGFMGLTLGPILNMYLSLPNGGELVMTALGGTGVIFLGLSGYALTTRKDFSFMGGFLMVGILVAFLAGIGALFFLTTQTSGRNDFNADETYEVSARFDNVGSLKVRAPVSMSGVNIGRVTNIEFDPVALEAVVMFVIDSRYDEIPDDSDASILTAGLLGSQYIGLQAGGSPVYLEEGSEVYFTQSAVILENLVGKFLLRGGSDEEGEEE